MLPFNTTKLHSISQVRFLSKPRLALIFATGLLFTCFEMSSAQAKMGIVTASPGKIMDGTQVMAEVESGTRLWVFKVSDDKKWAEVKVPNKEQHGQMEVESIKFLEIPETQLEDVKLADAHFAEYERLENRHGAKLLH